MTKYIFTKDLPPTSRKKGDVVGEEMYTNELLATWLALGIVEEVKEEEWPKDNDLYYYVSDRGTVRHERWYDTDVDNDRKKVHNCYRTEAEALEAQARVERAYKGI